MRLDAALVARSSKSALAIGEVELDEPWPDPVTLPITLSKSSFWPAFASMPLSTASTSTVGPPALATCWPDPPAEKRPDEPDEDARWWKILVIIALKMLM